MSHDVCLLTRSNRWQKLLAVDAVTASYPALAASLTPPTAGVLTVTNLPPAGQPGAGDHLGLNRLRLLPFGVGADDGTFSMLVLGWDRDGSGEWVPTPLAEWTACTLSTFAGLAGGSVDTSHRFCDLATATAGYPDVQTAAGGIDQPAVVSCPLRGFALLQVLFALGTATAANALAATY